MTDEYVDYMEAPFSGISDSNKQLRGLKSKDEFSLNRLLKIKTVNIIINSVNCISVFLLSIISIRFCLQIAGISYNIFYKITYFFLAPFFWLSGTGPLYGNFNVEKEALMGIAFYALMATVINGLLNFLKEFIKFRKKAYFRE